MIFHIAANSCQLFEQLDVVISTRYNAVFCTVYNTITGVGPAM